MKYPKNRIDLSWTIYNIVASETTPYDVMTDEIVKFIQNNYRRRRKDK